MAAWPARAGTAVVSNRALNQRADDTAAAVFTFPSGALAEVTTSWNFVAAEHSVEVYGSDGTALLSGVDLASKDFSGTPYLKVFQLGEARGVWEPSPAVTSFAGGAFHHGGPRHFIECLRNGRGPALGVEEGRRPVEMILAAYRAAASGCSEPIMFARSVVWASRDTTGSKSTMVTCTATAMSGTATARPRMRPVIDRVSRCA